ncbi:electron transporter SCO1/SenC [Brucella endophytica]|uniref:Electron transporter SCO1/SenC n=1 Tax=Brucella endophytica TaxID=1963359 RepID=A0A916SFB7_9HYPH|nr:SCO family protein [Brucella endophytica]GGA97462.1 electron transporter SCO1/SenC [Brucella endophytica]
MRRTFPVIVIALIAVLSGALAFNMWRDRSKPEDAPFGGQFELTATDGKPITDAAFRSHPSAIFFGFTHCPDVCPTTLFELDGWLKKLGPEGENIRAYFVTVDPERDDVATLKTYIGNVSQRITGITGAPDKVAAMLRAYHVYARKVPGEDGDYTMDHTASIFLLDSKGRFRGTIAYGENPDTAIEKLRKLAAE